MDSQATDWIGRTEQAEERITLAPAQQAAAMLDDTATELRDGSTLPPLWHWLYFLPKAPASRIGPDGHPQRGGFMPPIDLPRRMFAGARLRFASPLRIGGLARRRSTIHDVSVKDGRSGRLAFVTVHHAIEQDGVVCIEEEQDIVYREPGAPVAAPVVADWPALAEGALSRVVTPDPVLLFRFSALTFNAHRIHYDRDYAMRQEGYPGLVVHGPLVALLLLEMVRRDAGRAVRGLNFRGQAPLFDRAPFRLVGVADGSRMKLHAQGPDGRTALDATADLA